MSIDRTNLYTYGYDTYGRLNKITTASGGFTYSRVANSELISQMTRPNNVTTSWTYEPHRNLLTQGANKNISDLAASNGTIAAHYEYTPFGIQTVAIGSYTANPFRFSAEYFDSEIELVYYDYRYYDSEQGRWLSQDPIQEIGGFNLYGFTTNSPTTKYDIRGLIDCCGTKEYDSSQSCCVNEKIIGKDENFADRVEIDESFSGNPNVKNCDTYNLNKCEYDDGKFEQCLNNKKVMNAPYFPVSVPAVPSGYTPFGPIPMEIPYQSGGLLPVQPPDPIAVDNCWSGASKLFDACKAMAKR